MNPAAGRASSRMKAITNRTTRTRKVVDSRKGRERRAISVESTCDRYLRAIHAHGTVPYGALQARGLPTRGARSNPDRALQSTTRRQSTRASTGPDGSNGGRVPSGARLRPHTQRRPDHDRRGRPPCRRPSQHGPIVVCQRATLECPDQSPGRPTDSTWRRPGPRRLARQPTRTGASTHAGAWTDARART